MTRKSKPPPKPARRRRGDGSISTAADGTIRARLPARIDPRRPSREFPPGQEADARAWLDGHLHPEALAIAPAALSVRDWAGTWLSTYIQPMRPPTTARKYRHALRALAPVYGTALPEVRASHLQAALGLLAVRVAAETVQATVGVWRRMFEAAVDNELLARNPARALVAPAAPHRPPARSLTAEEVARLWPAIRGARFEPAHALLLGMGLRFGEVHGLRWEHVDFGRGRVWIGPQFTNGAWRDLPKSRNPHWAPLPQAVAEVLQRHRKQHPDDVLVLQSPYRGHRAKREKTPRPWSRDLIVRELRELAHSVGVAGVHPHAARHGLASHLLAGGATAAVIAERLGNTPAVVLNRYAHGTDDGREAADRLVDAYLPGAESGDQGANRAAEDGPTREEACDG